MGVARGAWVVARRALGVARGSLGVARGAWAWGLGVVGVAWRRRCHLRSERSLHHIYRTCQPLLSSNHGNGQRTAV